MYDTHAVVVITYKRPAHLQRCLSGVFEQSRPPDEVVVVDQSPDDLSRVICSQFPGARWIDNRVHAGNMTNSRNIGLCEVASDIVSFIDDDSMPTVGWAEHVLAAFGRHEDAGCIAGRVTEAGEPAPPGPSRLTDIGRISRDGQVLGHFYASTTNDVETAHALGANMSFVREVLVRLGGFREDYPGTAMGEDTDISIRVRQAGWRIYFAPSAHLVHDSAPHVVGLRFGLRYEFFASANYMWLFVRNFGWRSPQVRGHLKAPLRQAHSDRRMASRAARVAVSVAGLAYGGWLSIVRDGGRRAPLVRAGTPRGA